MEENKSTEVSKQPTIEETLEKRTKVDPKSDLQKKFDRLLVEMIGTNFLAFSFIDSPEFHNFVAFLNKTFNIKTAQTYRRGMSSYAKGILSKVIQQRRGNGGHNRYLVVAHSRLMYLAHLPFRG